MMHNDSINKQMGVTSFDWITLDCVSKSWMILGHVKVVSASKCKL